MAIIILVIFDKIVNFQCFATLELSKVAVGIKQYYATLCNTMQCHQYQINAMLLTIIE